MAEPQTATPAEEGRNKGTAAPERTAQGAATHAGAARPDAAGERRSFGQGDGQPQHAETRSVQAPDTVARGAQAAAESTLGASRQAMTAWRQALDPFLAMQYDLGQWFDDVFRQTFGFRATPAAPGFRPMSHFGAASLFGLPPADLKETGGAHVLSIELPGLNREDVDLAVVGETLVLSGHKAEESEDAAATYRVSERRYGRFERAFPLPPDVEPGRISAQFKDGVLRVTLPKSPGAAQARARIEIKG